VTIRTPLVSVCIPTYKGGATIGAAIESVLRQSLADFEIVVLDDGSPDDTAGVVKAFSDTRVIYLRNERNLGPQGNWNRCLEGARGRYFKLLPHDDLLHPQCLEQQVKVLEADRACKIALVFSAREVIGPDGRVLTRRGYPGAAEGPLAARSVISACVRRGTNLLGEPGAVMFRKDLADQVGGFDGTNPYVIDLDYWFRLLAHGDAYYCADALASFRVWPQSWSVTIGSGQSTDFRNFVSRVGPQVRSSATLLDRICGRISPSLNNLARLAFYRLYLR
jgi:glycosyltransferase involved in cell wall biosynthesis